MSTNSTLPIFPRDDTPHINHDLNLGILLAMLSSLAIGSSYVTIKIGLRDTHVDSHSYLSNPTWWAGMFLHAIGELFNFAAYAFAPAILVTPLGALSVLTGTVLGAYFLGERLDVIGRLGCALCLVGSVLIVANAPAEKEVESVEEMMTLAMRPWFLLFAMALGVYVAVMVGWVCPRYGRRNPLFYLSICAATGAISVMALKAFGIAVKLTLGGGGNQFLNVSTYAFGLVAVACIVVQMNYFNKALNVFPQSVVSPIYYVTFTTAVLTASFILFEGFNITDDVKSMSLLAAFLTIFTGVYLLNFNGSDLEGQQLDTNFEYELASISTTRVQSLDGLRQSTETGVSQHSADGTRRRG